MLKLEKTLRGHYWIHVETKAKRGKVTFLISYTDLEAEPGLEF